MSSGLKRFQQEGDLHFLTFSCFRHRPHLASDEGRDKFLEIIEAARDKYRFRVVGYVVMPDHVHLLVSEPAVRLLSTAVQVIKQRFSRWCSEKDVWETRYYDFNVYSEDNRVEKLRYIHRNPVKRGLVSEPGEWKWSSFRWYMEGVEGVIQVDRT